MPPKSDKKPMDSKFEFWNDLPNEMRSECIKQMDFKSRMQLRATSKQDKLLVESAPKYHFDKVEVLFYQCEASVLAFKSGERVQFNRCCLEIPPPSFFEQAQRLLISILKFSTAKSLNFTSNFKTDEAVSEFLVDISEYAPFRFKYINLRCNKLEIVKFWLKNCTSAVSIRVANLSIEVHGADVMDVLQFPSVINAKFSYFGGLKATEITYQLIKKWLDKDHLEDGKRIDFDYGAIQNLDFLAEKFQNRVVSKTDKTLRIRTDDSTKHILIRNVFDHRNRGVYSLVVVIPFDEKEPE